MKTIRLHKHLYFPVTSQIDEDGVRNFINNMDNETIYTDKTGLGDLKEFQKAEFNITDGYYVNEGRNETINHATY